MCSFLLLRYGGAEHLPQKGGEGEGSGVAAAVDLPSASETYVEYSATGRVLKGPGAGAKPAMPKSKYEEDGNTKRKGKRKRSEHISSNN